MDTERTYCPKCYKAGPVFKIETRGIYYGTVACADCKKEIEAPPTPPKIKYPMGRSRETTRRMTTRPMGGRR